MATSTPLVVADFTTSLAAGVSAGDVTATIQSAVDTDGVTLTDGLYAFTIDGSNSKKEYILATITGASLAGIQSISRQGALTTGFARKHRIGATVVVTDHATLRLMSDVFRGVGTLNPASPLKYDSALTPTLGQFQVPSWDYVKAYADALAIAGAPDASTAQMGIGKITATPSKSLGTCTISIASPGVVSLTAHGLVAKDRFKITTTGTLPTGITANTLYYVIATGLTANTFQFSATESGSTINTSGSQSGVHTLVRLTPFFVGDDDARVPTQAENDILAQVVLGTDWYAATSTGNDSYAITLNPVPTAYANGMTFKFKTDVANTGAATLNVNGLGAITIKKLHDQDLITGDIEASQMIEVIYNSTGPVFEMQSQVAQVLQNDYQSFTASGTWTKPAICTGNEIVRVQLWGAGGGGGGAVTNTSAGAGGGGGGYGEYYCKASDLSSTETVTIGTGGAGGVSAAAGTSGGNTTFGSKFTAYGGGGGYFCNNGTSAGGGGGGGKYSIGGTGAQNNGGVGGDYGGGVAGTSAPTSPVLPTQPTGGGGGGWSNQAGSAALNDNGGGSGAGGNGAGAGGASKYGGGGGGSNTSAGGTSIFGGAGGAGGAANSNGVDGTAPGGGGGGANTTSAAKNGGAGARGECRVWVLF